MTVITLDDKGDAVSYAPGLTGEEYLALIEPFITLAQETADKAAAQP